jgi:hypothetical protein
MRNIDSFPSQPSNVRPSNNGCGADGLAAKADKLMQMPNIVVNVFFIAKFLGVRLPPLSIRATEAIANSVIVCRPLRSFFGASFDLTRRIS